MSPNRTLPLVLLLAAASPAGAQTVIQVENVRTEYARVLRAEPVYQTLRATAMVEECDDAAAAGGEEQKRGLARVVGAVKDALTPNSGKDEKKDEAAPAAGCRVVPSDREFRRPIAYDVDYVHHGVKYRSRLPYDPGDRLRVRVSITPIVPAGTRP
ncbi:MAG TPA: hypothetical protein VM619_13075 [Luteimonas sp.]|nr:hypothetical protein [Luteimonas sp.]